MNLSQTTSGPVGNHTGANGSLRLGDGSGGPCTALDLGPADTNSTAVADVVPELEDEPVPDT